MNTFGSKLRLTTFGSSHENFIGGVLDGFPAGVKFDLCFVQNELNKRKSGSNFTSSRKESDRVEILSGIFNQITTGQPIAMLIKNENAKSNDYDNIKNIFRPGHADFTYLHKFGIRDHRGGGRSSARESAIRVCGGAIAQLMLNELNIEVQSGVFSVGNVNCNEKFDINKVDFEFAQNSEIFSLFSHLQNDFKNEILKAKNSHDSVGASVITIIKNAPIGLGEVLYDKFDARIAQAFMGINAVKAIEIGSGVDSSKSFGSLNNDNITMSGFVSNNAGGILGGITNGDDIIIKTHFKPTPSIFKPQISVNSKFQEVEFSISGRHDPCVGIRGSVVATAMARLVLADMLLLNLSSKIENVKKIYKAEN